MDIGSFFNLHIPTRDCLAAYPLPFSKRHPPGRMRAQLGVERMPRVIDPRYAAPLEVHDPEQPEGRGALLVAPLGRGTYIYTTLALVQQLPAAVPGAARLFVNLMSAGLESAAPGR